MSKSKNTRAKTNQNTVEPQMQRTDVVFGAISNHPFIFTVIVCLMMFPFGFAQKENISEAGIVVEAILWIIAAAALTVLGKPGRTQKETITFFLGAASMTIIFSVSATISMDYEHTSAMFFAPFLVSLGMLGGVLWRNNKLNADRIVMMMILMGIAVRYVYCLTHNSLEMQHDIGSFDGEHGHLSYITYWYRNDMKLPDFNVTTRWQFYHPPLNHFLMAILMKVFTSLGMPLSQAQEAIQILPMLWSSLCMAVCFRICKLVQLKGAGLVAAMTAVCFYPTFIIWSGAYNNDILTTFLMLLAMLWTLKWAKKPTLINILPIALCIGLGMMTKLSAWMVAPAVAMVFLWVLIKNIRRPLPFIGQYVVFGTVCAPLGLWWGIRNLLTFNIPITYVPDIQMSSMSVEHIPVLQRLFDFNFSQFSYPYEAFTIYQAPYNEYNPIIGLVKTSLFDEYSQQGSVNPLPVAMVIIACVLALIGVVSLIWMLFKRNTGMDLMTRLFFAVIFFTIIISYVAFCFQFPYVCTENIRYCIPVIPILGIATGFGLNGLLEKRRKATE